MKKNINKPKDETPESEPRREPHILDRLGPREDKEAVIRNIIGPKIKQRRVDLGWSQAQLGERISKLSDGKWSVTDEDVRRFETQRKIITDREIPLIADALQCGVGWLLSENNATEPLPFVED